MVPDSKIATRGSRAATSRRSVATTRDGLVDERTITGEARIAAVERMIDHGFGRLAERLDLRVAREPTIANEAPSSRSTR